MVIKLFTILQNIHNFINTKLINYFIKKLPYFKNYFTQSLYIKLQIYGFKHFSTKTTVNKKHHYFFYQNIIMLFSKKTNN